MQNSLQRFFAGTISLVIICTGLCMLGGCKEKSNADELPVAAPQRATVSDDGKVILIPEASPGLNRFASQVIARRTALVSISAPGRIVASISPGASPDDKSVLFESADVTSLYSQYRQAKSNFALTHKNYERTKEMFANQGATIKDMNQAEADYANAQAALREFEGKLRTAGFAPNEFDAVGASTVWLLSDVPEIQLHEIRKGESVKIHLTSYPDRSFSGRADAIGDVIDPSTRTVKVRVSMANPDGRFLPGMFARIDFGEPEKSVVILPLSSIVTVNSLDYAFVELSRGRFERRQITVANTTDSGAVVLKGIEGGEHVVTEGAMLLKGLSFGY